MMSYMGKGLFKHPLFTLYLDGFIKWRSISQEMFISISLVGSLYVTGGAVDEVDDLISSSQVDVVDVSSGETSRGPSMRHPRESHAAAASTASLFVFGGLYTETGNSCELFNAQAKQ